MPLHVIGAPQTRDRAEKEAEVRGNHAMNRQQQQQPQRPANNRDNGSLNHLLGFTLPPRQHPPPRTSRRSTGRQAHWGHTRERYTNAQYRFMLKPTGDYAVHFADPDIYFNWPDVLQVIVPTSTVLPAAAPTFEGPSTSSDSLLPSCPICLSEPVAPRMTKCGHIFCFPCLLHYLELAEGPGQKVRSCPICFDTVYARELKSVKWFDPVSAASETEAARSPLLEQPAGGVEQEEGDFITMRLMHRTTISTLALPRSPTWPSELIPPHAAPWHFAPDILGFSRFMLATPDYLTAELRKDLQQLDAEVRNLRQLGTASDDLGLVFIETARIKVLEQIEKVSTLRTDHIQRTSETAWLEFEALKDKEGAAARRREWEQERALASTTSASETDEYVPPDSVLHGGQHQAYRPSNKPQAQRTTASHPSPQNPRNNRTRRNINPPPLNDATYLFYQAASGQHIYLHPLDIKILMSHFGSYSAFPLAIRVKVEGTEEGSMNDDLRKRCRYLAHLPEACDLTFVEADLSKVISPEALAPYAQALKKRVTKRKEKSKKDDRARIKSEQAAQEKEREAMAGRSHRRRDPGEPMYTSLDRDMSTFSFSEDDPPLSTSPSAATTAPAPGENSTVWGTRAIAAAARQQREEESYAELAADSAWNDFDMMHERGGRRQGRKKKVVLNLSGGAVQMRR